MVTYVHVGCGRLSYTQFDPGMGVSGIDSNRPSGIRRDILAHPLLLRISVLHWCGLDFCFESIRRRKASQKIESKPIFPVPEVGGLHRQGESITGPAHFKLVQGCEMGERLLHNGRRNGNVQGRSESEKKAI